MRTIERPLPEARADNPAAPVPAARSKTAPKRRRRWGRHLVWLLMVATLGAAIAWFRFQGNRPPVVQVDTVRTGPLETSWSATGYVEARTARLSPPQAARVQAVLVREGDRVRPGQVLVRLAADLLKADAEGRFEAVRAARADEAAARATLRETERRLSDRIAQAEAGVDGARSRVAQARAALERETRVAEANAGAAKSEVDAAAQQLAELKNGPRPQEVAQAEAAVADAEAVQRRAAIERERQVRLLREGAVARKAVDDAQEALDRAEAQVKRTRAALDLLRQGTRPEEIAAANARLQAARQRLAAAEAQQAGVSVLERDLEEQSAGLKQAEAVLAEARSARGELETLRARVAATERRTAQAAASHRGAKSELVERTLMAPFAGYVGRRLVDPGDLAVPGQPLLSIVEADHAWVEAEADEQDLAPLEPGQRVAVTIPSYPGRSFPGLVTRIGAEAIPQIEQTRTSARMVRVRVSLELLSPTQRRLFKPGLEVDVAGQAVLARHAVLVPNDAVRMDASGPYVLVTEGDRLARRQITTGHPSGRVTQVVRGLKAGERVVVSAAEGLKEGSRVTVQPVP